MTSPAERELGLMIKRAQRMPSDQMELCKDWTKEEIAKAKKMNQKINQLQNQPDISSELFNEARDCCDLLQQWIRELEINLEKASRLSTFNTLTDLGRANQAASY